MENLERSALVAWGVAAVEGSASSLSSFLKTQRFPAGPWEGRCSFGFCGREAGERSCFLAPSPYRHHPVTQQGPDRSLSATAPFSAHSLHAPGLAYSPELAVASGPGVVCLSPLFR